MRDRGRIARVEIQMQEARKLSGPKARYRGKVRRPFAVTLTPDGHAALAEGIQASGLSRIDYIEELIRKDKQRRDRRRGPMVLVPNVIGQHTKH